MTSLEQALKQEYAYLKFQNFIITHSYLFSDSEYKVITSLYSMLDYSLQKTFVVVSQTELMICTGKRRQSIYSILERLEKRGFIVKISGKHNKELSLKLREEFFGRKQDKLRSFNEKNVYDLSQLLNVIAFLMRIEKMFSKIEFYEFLMSVVQNENETIQEKIIAVLKEYNLNDEIAILLSSQRGDSNILSSDSNILSSDSNILSSDSNIIAKTNPTTNPSTTHTHHIGDGKEEREKTSTGLSVSSTPAQKEQEAERYDKKEIAKEINPELRDFILADLQKQEQEGKIKNATAIFKTLTDEDIENYRKRFESENKKQQYKVLVVNKYFLNDVKKILPDNQIYETGTYAYILIMSKQEKKIREYGLANAIDFAIRDYTDDFAKIFEN